MKKHNTMKKILTLACAAAITVGCADKAADTQSNPAVAQSIEERRFERRALEAGTWIMPQVMYERMAQVAFDTFGGDATNTVYYYAKPMTHNAAMVTGNNNSLSFLHSDLATPADSNL